MTQTPLTSCDHCNEEPSHQEPSKLDSDAPMGEEPSKPKSETVEDRPAESTHTATSQEKEEDPHNIASRFVLQHQLYFKDALREIENGRKESCWAWFILPTPPFIVDGIERGSEMNREFALRGDAAAEAFLTFGGGLLRSNYLLIVRAISSQLRRGATLKRVLGPLDDSKAISSFQFFERIGTTTTSDPELVSACQEVLSLAGAAPKKRTSRGIQDWLLPPPKPRDKKSAEC